MNIGTGVRVDEAPTAMIDVGYRSFIAAIECAYRGKRLRIVGYEKFVERFDDLNVWMQRPTPARLDDVSRANAWPFISWCFASGAVRPDVDLLATRSHGGHFTTWARLHATETQRAVQAGTELGWAPAWTHQVCVSTLAFLSMTTAATIDTFTDQLFDSIAAEVRAAPHVTACHRKVLQVRLHALRQVCFQIGTLDRSPVNRNVRVHSLVSHVAAIPQPDIRATAERYLRVIATTLRPSTVEDRGENLELFGIWLAEHHSTVSAISQLDRAVIEDFLCWNHDRLSRGRRAAGRPVSKSRQHSTVAALKTFLEDIALWEWPERPRRPLLHRSDLPRLDDAIPRALPPDHDRELMTAVDRLPDTATRLAIKILRGTGIRLGELLDLELDCLLDYTDHGTWLKVPVGKTRH